MPFLKALGFRLCHEITSLLNSSTGLVFIGQELNNPVGGLLFSLFLFF